MFKERCLALSVNAHGLHIGSLHVYDDGGNEVTSYVGSVLNADKYDWFELKTALDPEQTLFVIEARKGGEMEKDEKGDICIDNIRVWVGTCGKKIISSNK